MPVAGLEPARPCGHRHLKTARLPIPPHGLPGATTRQSGAGWVVCMSWTLAGGAGRSRGHDRESVSHGTLADKMKPFHATTVLSVRRGPDVALGADGQVTMNDVVAKADAVKVRKLDDGGAEGAGVLIGFAGSAADAFALLEKFETQLRDSPANIKKASIELAKLWRTDRMLRRLESMLVVADRACSLLVSGSGDVIEPGDGVLGIGSGGAYATAAARAICRHTEQAPREVVQHGLEIAAELCVYTNENISVLTL